MKIKAILLATVIAAAAAMLGNTPACADGLSLSFGYHGGHHGHGHRYRHRRWHRRHHGHYRPYRRHYYAPRARVYHHDYYDAPRYAEPVYVPSPPAAKMPPPAANTAGYCREYTRDVVVDGQPSRAYGQACRQPDGSWRIVSQE